MQKRLWLVAATLVTFLFGLFYIAVQQTLRLSANDPQTAIAHNVAATLGNSGRATIINGRIDVAYSPDVFTIVYDQRGAVVGGNGYLDGRIPRIPYGVLLHTPVHGTHAVTWEPKPGLRVAAVSARNRDYYVVSGRSLAVTEERVNKFTTLMITAWLLTITAMGAAAYFAGRGAGKGRQRAV